MTRQQTQSGFDVRDCTRSKRNAVHATKRDALVVEAPFEMRLNGDPYATVMRTPGADRDLVLGFFLAEGVISTASDVSGVVLCGAGNGVESTHVTTISGPNRGWIGPQGTNDQEQYAGNVADLRTTLGRTKRPASTSRLPVTSSCGVCGHQTITDVLSLLPAAPENGAAESRSQFRVPPSLVATLPDRLQRAQPLFQRTGALHGAALFDAKGNAVVVREDIGRHNAVDKVIGQALLIDKLPASRLVLQVSGRVSFEIIQKAYRAGIRCVTAVSGVSTLAVDLASQAGITLVGFVRGGSFNIYTHPERIRDAADATEIL